jgi:NAD(P)-dependent dehydrogenase (short-subunit alcohol dehydrogenase family)
MKTNRTVVITGAAGGMGALIARRFLDNGDTVIATDNSEEALTSMADKLGRPDHLATIQADITDAADCVRIAGLAKSRTGQVDVLVQVAGFFPIEPFMEITPDSWRKIIDINLTGTALVAHAMLPLMVGRGWGRIINFGSASIYGGVEGQTHYVAAKAGVVGFSRSLAREVGRDGITVNMIAPGLTVTKAVKDRFPKEILDAQIERRAIKREQTAEDLVGPTFFLASPDADFITGQSIIVDGGAWML